MTNVIKALEHCKDNQYVNDCDKCDYGGKTGMFCIRMIDDVITMLKEQEAKKVIESTNMYTGLPITHCPKCGKKIYERLDIILTSYPPKRQYECDCGWVGYH